MSYFDDVIEPRILNGSYYTTQRSRKVAFEQKEGGGTLFRNTQKQGAQPDWRGDCLINGKKMKIAAWEKQGSKGIFLSLKIQEDNYKKEEYPSEQNKYNDPHPTSSPSGRPVKNPPLDELEDEIPFHNIPNVMVTML